MDPAISRGREGRRRRTVLARPRPVPLRLRGRPAQVALVAAAALAAASGCASGPARGSDRPETCPNFVAARPQFPRLPEYPPTARKARMTGESTHELVVDRDGKVRDAHILGTSFMVFAMAADEALRKSLYFPATLDGRPVGSRLWVRVPFGAPPPPGIESSAARNRVTAFVPGDESARARRQLSGSIRRVTVAGEIASSPPEEVSVVAIAPGGAERVLLPKGGAAARMFRASVRTGDFFSKPGEYRIRLAQGDRVIGEGGFTVAQDEGSAVVNACETP
ncbi:MAG TPA: energy transducer TonB [Thermoanaerobaculia bacterium]